MPDTPTVSQQDSAVRTTTLRVPDSLWAAVRKAAIDRRISAQKYCIEALTQYMAKDQKRASKQ